MLHVVCVNAGNYQGRGAQYVNTLYDMVKRNLPDGFPGEFVCFTDDPTGLDPNIVARELPHPGLQGWWNKLALFKPGLFPNGHRVIYFDLDTVITGRLDEIVAYHGDFAILRDFYRLDGLQSSVMLWRVGSTEYIWNAYKKQGYPQEVRGRGTWGDQAFIEMCSARAGKWWVRIGSDEIVEIDILQSLFPGLFISYKASGKGSPDKASVVVFHGEPRPHDVVDGWVPHVWKVGGMFRADLDVVANVSNETLLENVRSSIKRPLAWFDTQEINSGHICIVGGGPSLEENLEELRLRAKNHQEIWALNGAGKYLMQHGIRPAVVVILDARKENSTFLDGLPAKTVGLFASQCHPDVFNKAHAIGMPVILWHANTPGVAELVEGFKDKPVHLIGGGTTVGMNAIVLAYAEGCRQIHLFGFDSSYRKRRHHAYKQVLNDNDRQLDALFRGKRYIVAPWMAQQVNEFQDLVPGLVADGCLITVTGDGLLPDVARDLGSNMPLTAAQIRAYEILKRIEFTGQPILGAEVGVFAGDLSVELLQASELIHLDMIDSWEGSGAGYEGDSGDWHAGLTEAQQDAYYRKAVDRTFFAAKRRIVFRMRSQAAAATLEGDYDFVFIDADHSYAGCKADIEAWAKKVKPGGLLCGHDYENEAFPKFGVKQAVDEFVAAKGLTLELGENYCWFVRMPVAAVAAA